MGDTFGRAFRITTFGESHGPALGVVMDGVPPGLRLDWERVQAELDRRRPGQSKLTTPRKESDRAEVLSGVFEGLTTGTALAVLFRNDDVDSSKYDDLRGLFRPSHADFTYAARYGVRDHRGGGRSSARETVARVAAGAVARQVLEHFLPGFECVAWVASVGDLQAESVDPNTVTAEAVDATPVRCPDLEAAAAMETLIAAVRRDRDTIGGVVSAVIRGVPAGLGDPVFDKLDAELAHAAMGLPAAKGVEIGSGFAGTRMRGSEHNDVFVPKEGRIGTRTNYSGGVQGGISNGEPILLRVAFKPVATLFRQQDSVSTDGTPIQFAAKGRHDPCVLPRAVPIVESMACLVVLDQLLRRPLRRDA